MINKQAPLLVIRSWDDGENWVTKMGWRPKGSRWLHDFEKEERDLWDILIVRRFKTRSVELTVKKKECDISFFKSPRLAVTLSSQDTQQFFQSLFLPWAFLPFSFCRND